MIRRVMRGARRRRKKGRALGPAGFEAMSQRWVALSEKDA
ncbi:hypothetical protein SCOR_02855 [Sulfidibacter corallicola]